MNPRMDSGRKFKTLVGLSDVRKTITEAVFYPNPGNPHMDVRKIKSRLFGAPLSIESEPFDPSITAHALRSLGVFSLELLKRNDQEGIRSLVVETLEQVLSVESAELFYSAHESSHESVRQVFGTGKAWLKSVAEGEAECVAAVRGSGGTVAVLRVAQRRDWTAFTFADLSILDSFSLPLGLRLENLRLTGELARHQASSVQALAAAIEVKDRYTSGHTKRVGLYSDAIVNKLPMISAEKERIRLAGVLHDIGKIGVPDRILLKPDRLTEAEWDEMRLHTEAGFDIVSRVAGLEEIAEILRHHHERWDGSGYPRGLAGEAIPFASRVIAVADTFDAIVTDRPYRAALLPSEAREIILDLAGTHFDPVVVEAFDLAFDDLEASALGR